MTDTTDKLLPCPFCGCAADGDWAGEFAVRCKNCPAEIQDETEEHAVAVWNRRVADKPKWTSETPTEEGWYLVTTSSRTRPCLAEVRLETINGEERMRMWVDTWCISGELWWDGIWLKIDIPAPPKKGKLT